MRVAVLHFTRSETEADDILRIVRSDASPGLFRIKYQSGADKFATKMANNQYLTRSQVVSYLETLFACMQHDVDPFENVQVSTEIHPPLMFHTSSLESAYTRKTVIDLIDDALRMHPVREQ